ncbi:MAG: hypothetical protein KC422_10200 [Trueperaceae bacterium]|nr:hypothetical protein [Trueperaceae bacterium]
MLKKYWLLSLLLSASLLVACGSSSSLKKAVATEADETTEEVTGTYTVESYPFLPAANIDFGSGFSTPNEKFLGVGNCLEYGEGITSLADALQYKPSTLKLEFDMDLATSREELADKMDLTASLKARIGIVNIDGRAKVFFDDETSSNDVYLIAKGKATGHTFGFLTLGEGVVGIKGYNAENPAESTGFGKLFIDDYKSFLERCGDRFVSSITLGGEFYLIAQIETYSEEHKKDIEGSLNISISSIGVDGGASLKKILDEASARTNMKIHLVSAGMFPEANTLINVQSNPGAVVEDLINGLKEQCLSIQNTVAQGALVTQADSVLHVTDLNPQAIDNFNEVLEHLSVCSKQVTLTDYKILTTEDGASNEAIKAMNAHFTASRLMNLLSILEDFDIDARYYIKNDSIFEPAQENPAAGEQATKSPSSMATFLSNEVADLRFALQEQLAKCQAGQFDDCKFVSIDGFGDATSDDYKAVQDDIRAWFNYIPPRGKWDLPNTCNALKDVRGARDFSSSTAYTIYYQRDLSRAYQVYCLPKEAAKEVELFGTPEDSRPEATSYYEYIQLKSPQNIARAITHATDVNAGAFDQVNGSLEQATRYDRIRINPIDLTIEPEDISYTFTVGKVIPVSDAAKFAYQPLPKVGTSDQVAVIPYGTAIGCNKNAAEATLNIEGTGLYFDPLMSERAGWYYTPHGDIIEPPRVVVEKQRITIDTGFALNCTQIRPADYRIKLSLPSDPSVLDQDGLYNDAVAFENAPLQWFILSGAPDNVREQVVVDDAYSVYLDGHWLFDMNGNGGATNEAWFEARQGQHLLIAGSNTHGGPCGTGDLYLHVINHDDKDATQTIIATKQVFNQKSYECFGQNGWFTQNSFTLKF